ncbi:sulfur oxidation c-type cytochrome SoxA [Polynucleobacter asymbioticus]|nr:sulfur oxidation c-type cytochrome SoxA [Polynucleobacter asymbioticus]
MKLLFLKRMKIKAPHFLRGLALLGAISVGMACANAQSTADEIAKYRQMIADGNPSDLYEDAGAELWKKPSGPKNVTLEKCNLGLGPGVIKGASAQLPRYFADTNKVQDLESRLITCMSTIQGISAQEIIDAPFQKGLKKDMDALVAYVVSQSKDQKIKVSTKHPKEKEAYELGKRAFYFEGGPMDFSCATCHGASDKRIRLQDLPNLTTQAGAAAGWGTWPAYRVSSGQFWTMGLRLSDCYRQQRFPFPIYGSDLLTAVSMYMAVNANGGVVQTPGLKR